jgi:methionine-rich copper-binding protein CopC
MRSTLSRRTYIAVFAIAACVAACVVAPSSSLAHSALRSTSPRQGERVTTPVSVIRMTFNETVSAPRIVVRDSQQRRVAGSLSATASIIEFRPQAAITGGNLTVTWQVRSRDGHAITGKWSFTVNAAPRTAPTATTTPKRAP